MKTFYWVSFSLACLGLAPMAISPLFGAIIKDGLRESVTFTSLLVGFLSAAWFLQIHLRVNRSMPPCA
jgi:hypothetical protein